MRQVKFAQQSVNVVAVVRNCAVVAVANALRPLGLLFTRFTGTTNKHREGYYREIYSGASSWGSIWGKWTGMQMQPVVHPIASPTTIEGQRQSACSHSRGVLTSHSS